MRTSCTWCRTGISAAFPTRPPPASPARRSSNFNHTYDITDSIAKVHGTHTIKGGIYLHKSLKDQTAFTSVNGIINFDRDANNPNDANWAFANALLGNYDTLQQSNQVLNGQYRSWNVEWYVQDNWRATRKFTLEYGIRFYWVQPQYDQALQTSSWNKSLYDPAARAVLRTAALDANGNRVSVNPMTGERGTGGADRLDREYRQGLCERRVRQRHGPGRQERISQGPDGRSWDSLCAAPGRRVPDQRRRP